MKKCFERNVSFNGSFTQILNHPFNVEKKENSSWYNEIARILLILLFMLFIKEVLNGQQIILKPQPH